MTTTSPVRTPPRILIPKLVRSRDAWKAKATARKAQRKTLEIRVRDLEASRELHRQRAEQLLLRTQQLQLQLQLDSARAAAAAPTPVDAPKNSTDPAAGTTTSASSNSP